MNLLSELEGLSGENLCSATLRLLLIRSHDLRERFVELLSRECRSGPIRLDSHFSCILEHPTDDSGRWGRLDLLLETSDAVIGLENKLYAVFQEGQPHKYLRTIVKHADGLAKLRRSDFRPIVAVLAPRNRLKEIAHIIGLDERFLMLAWEDLLDDLMEAQLHIDSMTQVLFQGLESYIHQQIALLPDFPKWVPHLKRRFDSKGTPLQREVVGKIWQFFPDPGRRLSCGDSWVGYYFTDSFFGTRGWYGFVPQREISHNARNSAELVIATSFPVLFKNPPFRPIKIAAGPRFIGASEIYAWAVEFEDSWSSPDVWRQSLKPLFEAYESIRDTKSKSDKG
jgi:hypothetical protein